MISIINRVENFLSKINKRERIMLAILVGIALFFPLYYLLIPVLEESRELKELHFKRAESELLKNRAFYDFLLSSGEELEGDGSLDFTISHLKRAKIEELKREIVDISNFSNSQWIPFFEELSAHSNGKNLEIKRASFLESSNAIYGVEISGSGGFVELLDFFKWCEEREKILFLQRIQIVPNMDRLDFFIFGADI